MREFDSPIGFEYGLITATKSILSGGFGDIRPNQRIGTGPDSWELDLVFTPNVPSAQGKIYIFEFKYSSSPTLPDSQIFTQLARFSALSEANHMHNLKFLLVTNGKARPHVHIPQSMTILDEVWNEKVWQEKLCSWIWRELPDFRLNQNPTTGRGYW